ncbi:MAG TPA: hypothetical protein VHL11_20270, partial [Phototrophicaceae bacterium]|nr:hypothetical protein [Phototrophicaceae bacterium]
MQVMTHVNFIIHSAAQLIPCAGNQPLRGDTMRSLQIIADGAVAIQDGIIVAVGSSADIRARYTADHSLAAQGKAVIPGFVDPHTHVVYAGDRVDEFERRIQGATYMEIMAQGGGINSTVRAVRAATLESIIAQTRTRLDAMLRLGTTTAEVKSGYGLNTENELKLLNAIAVLDQTHPIDLIPTFMGAHAIPPEYAGHTDDYVDLVINDMIPAVADWYQQSHFKVRGVPLFIDVFCEQNAFTREQSHRILA